VLEQPFDAGFKIAARRCDSELLPPLLEREQRA
jgi:hypothetical protein